MLSVENLKIEFYDHSLPETAVDDVTFTMGEGEILGIVGESGSGKSLTALSIAGLLNRGDITKSGDIVFNGLNLLHCKRSELRELQGKDIAMIFQEPMTSLNPVFTIEKQVSEPFMIHQGMTKKEARAKVVEMLSDVKIPNPETVAKQYPHQLSGGMRQRVMIAMALACEPDILIADEPTTALDVTIQAQILELMQDLQKKTLQSKVGVEHRAYDDKGCEESVDCHAPSEMPLLSSGNGSDPVPDEEGTCAQKCYIGVYYQQRSEGEQHGAVGIDGRGEQLGGSAHLQSPYHAHHEQQGQSHGDDSVYLEIPVSRKEKHYGERQENDRHPPEH